VVTPISVDEYRIAQMHMVTKIQQLQTTGEEGVEVLVNEPLENEEWKGQFTSKIYHLQSKFPSWLAAFAPLNSMLIEEKAWNAYTKCKTGWSLSWPLYVGTRFQHNFFTTRECGFSHKRSCGS
jgi:hypothetical protein